MSIRNRYILFLLLSTLVLQIYIVLKADDIMYMSDTVRGFFLQVRSAVAPAEDRFRIVRPASYRKYKATYAGLPSEYRHAGYFLFYRAPRDIRLNALADEALRYTHYFKRYQLERAIREHNGINGAIVRRGDVVYIPHSLPVLLPDFKRTLKPALIHSRGLYYTGGAVGSEKILRTIDRYVERGINTIVFDVKDITGIVNYRSHTPGVIDYNTHRKRTIDDIDKLIRVLREKNLYIIARIAVFRDHLLYERVPEFAIRSKKTGGRWNEDSAELWCDPTNVSVQDYNIALAIELAEKGVDEIQFDYIRFPTAGNLRDAAYTYSFGKMTNEAAITHFLARAHAELSKRNTLLSIDIFGVVAWGKEVDIRLTGQRIEMLAPYCDVISPMLYPSHFNDNFDGYASPGDNPYYFINRGVLKVKAFAKGKPIRPWLQAFKWRTSAYNENYILEQIKAANDAGALGYLFWNASNNYEYVYDGLAKLASVEKKNDIAQGAHR